MKLYKRMVRAYADEAGDMHFKLRAKTYPWYDEDDFPPDMEERVAKDNPFGGWYTYRTQEKYVLVEETINEWITEI